MIYVSITHMLLICGFKYYTYHLFQAFCNSLSTPPVAQFPNPLAAGGTGHEVQLEHYVDTFLILRLFVKDYSDTS